MRLARFIHEHTEEILQDFEDFAREFTESGADMDVAGLRDHAEEILEAIVLDLGQQQTASEQERKGKGQAPRVDGARVSAAEHHGVQRASDDFSLAETVSEYRALRASVLRLWERSGAARSGEDALYDLVRFNEGIDQALAESIDGYAGELARLQEEQAGEEGRVAARVTRVKTDFLQMVSHELRTPLHAIAGYHELLAAEMHGPLTPGQQDVLGRMKKVERHLLGIIEGILGFQESGEAIAGPLEGVEVREALETLRALVEPTARKEGVSFTIELDRPDETRVLADPEKLGQVLLNLVTNALRFTPEGGRVWVDYVDAPAEGCLRVHDTGPGIPPDQIEAIFEPFVQLDMSLTRPHGGVGLGLAISRRLAQAMDGSITAASRPGGGSTFTVRLPRSG